MTADPSPSIGSLLRRHRHARFSLAWSWLGNAACALLVPIVLAPFALPFGQVALTLVLLLTPVPGAFVPRLLVRRWRLRALLQRGVDLDLESVVAALDVKATSGGIVLESGDRTFTSGELRTATRFLGRATNRRLYDWLRHTLSKELEPLARAGKLGRVRARYVSYASNPNVPPEPLPFSTIVDRLLAAPRALEGPTLLVQRNPRDAVIALGSMEYCVLLEIEPGEDVERTLAGRLEAAFAKERENVRRAVDKSLVWVVLVNGGRALNELQLTPLQPISALNVRPRFLRIEGNTVQPDAIISSHLKRLPATNRVGELLRRGLQTPVSAVSETTLAELERQGEHLLGAEGDANERTRASWWLFYALVTFWSVNVVLSVVFGGLLDYVVAVPMGALLPASSLDGEWWRGLTAEHLHFGPLHLAGNSLALRYLWPGLTNALGGWRTVFLFFMSGLLAAFLSLFVSKSMGAGASGGVFGLLGALIVLSWRRPWLMPARRRSGFLVMGLLLLAFNVVPSLQAGVSTSAHAGGLAIGGLLVWLGAATVGLPPLDAPSGDKGRFENVYKVVVIGFACAVVASFALCWHRYHPWRHRWPAPLEARSTPIGVDVSLPRGAQPLQLSNEDPPWLTSNLADPFWLELSARPEPLAPSAALEATRAELAKKGPGKNKRWDTPPEVITRNGRSFVQAITYNASDSIYRRHEVIFEHERRIDLYLASAPGLGAPWPRVLDEITDSVHAL
jgi:membrane associated rhomboid family serine protease